MNMLFNLGWSSLIVFFVLSLIGIWVSYSFLNKHGLYLFCVIASLVCVMVPNATVFSNLISISTVIMPIVFFAIVATFNKFGKAEAIKLFLITIITQIVAFIVVLVQSAYIDASIQTRAFMSWEMMGGCFANILSLVFACFCAMIFQEKVNLKKLNSALQTACLITVACAVENFVFTIVAYAGILSFGKILLTFLIKVVISLIIATCLGYFENFLNRQLILKVVKSENKNQKSKDKDNDKNTKINTENSNEQNNQITDNSGSVSEVENNKEESEEDINYDNSAN